MPNIREYQNPINGIKPDDMGAEAFARSGRVIEENYNKAGALVGGGVRELGKGLSEYAEQADKQATLHQVSQGVASASAVLADNTQKWNDLAAHTDPNNMGAAREQFLNGLKDDLGKFQGGFTTDHSKLWGAEHAANLLNHFNEKTLADVSTAAGQSLKINVMKMGDNLAATIHNDPSSIDAALAMVPSSIEAMVNNSHSLSAAQAITAKTELTQELQQRITHLSVASTMDRNVAAGTAMLTGKYANFLRPEDLQQLENYGKTVTRANHADAVMARQDQEFKERQASEARAKQFLNEMAPLGPDGRPGPVQIQPDAYARVLQDKTMKPSEQMTVFTFMDRITKDRAAGALAHNDPAIVGDFIARIGDPENPVTQTDIADAVKAGKMTPQFGMELFGKASAENQQAMTKLNADPIVKAEFDRAAARITNNINANGIGGMNQAVRDKIDQFKMDQLRTLQDAVANKQDYRRFLDPKNPDYLFSDDKVDVYKPTKEDIAKQLVASPVKKPAGTPEQPREDLGAIMGRFLNFSPRKPTSDEIKEGNPLPEGFN